MAEEGAGGGFEVSTLGRLELHPRSNRPSDPDVEVVASNLQVVMRLQVEPPFGTRAEIPGEPEGGVGADGPPAADDLANPERWHPQGFGESVLGQSERLHEVAEEDFTRVNRGDPRFPCSISGSRGHSSDVAGTLK